MPELEVRALAFLEFWHLHRGNLTFSLTEVAVRANEGRNFTLEERQFLEQFFDNYAQVHALVGSETKRWMAR